EQGLALVGQDRLVLVAARAVAGDDDRRQGLPGRDWQQDAARRDLRQAVGVLVAEDVVDRDVLVELVVERERGAVQVHLLLVLLHEAVVVRRVHVGRPADLAGERDDRDAAVRLIVLLVVV